MKHETLNIFDKILFYTYVVVVLYILNPVALVLTLGLLCSPTIAIVKLELITLLGIAACSIFYHYFIWLKFRARFMRYEGMYFDIFIPQLVERRRYDIKNKNCNRRHGDKHNGKSKNQQRTDRTDVG